MELFDVAVAGGGPGGAAVAIVLARRGRRVLLAENSPPRRFQVGEGLPPSARSLLVDLDIAERFDAQGHRRSFGNVSAWGSAQLDATDFIRHPAGYGYQLDRARFDAMLREAAADAGAEVLPASRLSIESPGDAHRCHVLRLEGRTATAAAERVHARWLVDAGGRASTLSLRLGAQRRRLDSLVSFALLMERVSPAPSVDEDGRTWVESVEGGWWYAALLPSGLRLAAYLTDGDLVDAKSALTASWLAAQLATTRHLGPMLAANGYRARGRPQGAGAGTVTLDCGTGVHWLAVGDAAQAFDPLSSQGISQALCGGTRAAQAIDAALCGHTDAVPAHAVQQQQIFRTYRQQLREVYGQERRWASSPFWERRHGREGMHRTA